MTAQQTFEHRQPVVAPDRKDPAGSSRPIGRHLAGLAALCALLLTGPAGCKPSKGVSSDPLLSPRLVEVAIVEPVGTASESFTGTVGARVESDLGFRVPGKVIERLVNTGQTVRRGQPLMRIDATDYAHTRIAREEDVAAARARWVQADADERRYRGLVSDGAVSRSTYDQMKAAADSARSALAAATAQARVAGDEESYAVLTADADGTVTATAAEPGQVVSAGQIVVRLAHAGPREAVVDLPETIRPAIGSRASAILYGTELWVPARLRQLSDAADPATRTFEARYVMDGAGASAPLGATVTISLGADRSRRLLSVPLGAIDDEGRGPMVWVLDRDTATVAPRPVRIAALGEEAVTISDGLTVGDTIVATGGHYLHQGEHVAAATTRAAMQ